MNTKSTAGFTLVEIMIVVAIIALLAAIAVPNFLRARLRSQATALVNDVRMIGSAAEQYAIENGLAADARVDFDSLVVSQYFKQGSKIYSGQSAVTLSGSTLGEYYSQIDPTAQITVRDGLRNLFTPTILTTDALWTN